MGAGDTKGRVLKAFEDADPMDLSTSEVGNRAGVTRMTAFNYIRVLVAEGKIEESRRIQNAVLYKLKEQP